MDGKGYRDWPFSRWGEMFHGIYGSINAGLSDEKIALHIVEEGGELAEDLRKHRMKETNRSGTLTGLLVNVPDVLAWLFALSGRHGNLEDMLWNKYPGACPYCLADAGCRCYDGKPDINLQEKNAILHERRKTGIRPVTLYDWQAAVERLYGELNSRRSLEEVGFHLIEEIGEVAKSMRLGDEAGLQEEMADIFSWSAALVNRAERLCMVEYRIDDMAWKRYPDRCPRCGSNPCGCASHGPEASKAATNGKVQMPG